MRSDNKIQNPELLFSSLHQSMLTVEAAVEKFNEAIDALQRLGWEALPCIELYGRGYDSLFNNIDSSYTAAMIENPPIQQTLEEIREEKDEKRRKQYRQLALRRASEGSLKGLQRREKLLIKFQFTCQYCLQKGDWDRGPDGHAWNQEHAVPRSRGGSNNFSNITLSCRTCNYKKGTSTATEFHAELALS